MFILSEKMTRHIIYLETESYFWKRVILLPTASIFTDCIQNLPTLAKLLGGGVHTPHTPARCAPGGFETVSGQTDRYGDVL